MKWPLLNSDQKNGEQVNLNLVKQDQQEQQVDYMAESRPLNSYMKHIEPILFT